jgi:predicted RNA methylase
MTTTMSELRKWQNVSAGPRQAKDFNRAAARLRAEGQSRDELYGVIGGTERKSTVMAMCSPVRPEVTALDEAIREKYGYEVTSASVRQIIADYEAATIEAAKTRPVEDNRVTPEEQAERNAVSAAREAAYQAQRDAEQSVMRTVIAKAPAGAKALIFAEYHVDNSDPMTDYFDSRTVRTVAIGWRLTSREDFRALRSAAGQFAETAHLASGDVEHRDNYSMGGGNYLSDHGSDRSGTGWVVRSRELPCTYVQLTEDAIPETAAAPVAAGSVTVTPSSLGREGIVEVRFAERPAYDVLEGLKAHGFRWARANRCWYGKDAAYAQSLADASGTPAAAPPAVPDGAQGKVIPADVLEVLGSATASGSVLSLPGHLDRALYLKVDKVLNAAGGKWDRHQRGHVFDGDAADAADQLITTGRYVTNQDLGYFPTPAPVVSRLIDLAEPGESMTVLEPSAGDGTIASAVAPLVAAVDCTELDAGRAGKIRAGGYAREVTAGDFLASTPAPEYDLVIMNPPFARKADIAHVRHALGFVKPGGRLVSVMSLGVMFRQDKATAEFRDLVTGSGGWFEELPADAFKVSGTGVRTVISVINA